MGRWGEIDLDCRPRCGNLADVLFCQCGLTFSLCSSVGTVGPHLIAVFNLGRRKTRETPRDSPYTVRWSGYCGEYTLTGIVAWCFFPSSFFAENIPKCPILVRCNGPYRQCVETPSTFVFFFLVYSFNNHHQTLQEVFYELSFCAKSGKRACAAQLLRCSLYILTSRLLCMGLKRGYLWQLEVVSVFHSRTAVRVKYSRPGEGVGGWGGGQIRWDEWGVWEERTQGSLRESAASLLFMRGILLVFLFPTMMTLSDSVLKPLLNMLLLSVPLLLIIYIVTSYSTTACAVGTNLWGHFLLLLSCLSIKLVYNGNITLPPT